MNLCVKDYDQMVVLNKQLQSLLLEVPKEIEKYALQNKILSEIINELTVAILETLASITSEHEAAEFLERGLEFSTNKLGEIKELQK